MTMIGPPCKGGPKVSVENQSNNTLSCYTTPSAASTECFSQARRGQAQDLPKQLDWLAAIAARLRGEA